MCNNSHDPLVGVHQPLEQVLDTIDDGFTVLDREWRFVYFNRAAAIHYGKPREELVGQSFWEAFPDAVGTEFEHKCKWAMAQQKTCEFDTFAPQRDKWYMVRIFPSPTGLSIYGREITQYKKAIEEQRRSYELASRKTEELKAALESIPDGCALYDADQRFVFINSAALAFTGHPLSYFTGRRQEETTPPETAKKTLPHLHRAYETGRPQKFELTFTPAIGQTLTKLISYVPFLDESGKVVELLAISHDITTRKQAEEALRQSKEEAEQANRAKDEFLAMISHELHTPVAAVLLYAKLLKSGKVAEHKRTEALDTIIRCAEDQFRLVKNLVDASRILHGRMHADFEFVNLAEVLRHTIDSLQLSAELKHVAITPDFQADVVVSGDAQLLRQVFSNLLANSLKFTPQHGMVTIALYKEGQDARIVVRDNGIGIAPEFMPHVFEPFRQSDSSTTREHGGMGLGLSIVKSVVQMHHGTVQAHSNGSGTGTTFTISLPLITESQA